MKNVMIVLGTIIAYAITLIGLLVLIEKEYRKTKFY